MIKGSGSNIDDLAVDDAKKKPSQTLVFSLVTGFSLAAVMLLLVIFSRLEVFSASPHIAFALFLGVVMTIIVGVGLMALVFHSDRSGHDERV